MYEQFLANNKQQEQQLANMGDRGLPAGPIGQNISNINADEDDDGLDGDEGDDHGLGNGGNTMDDDDMEGGVDEEIDLDNIDYDQLDPQILEIAEQMGVHPREVLK